MVKRKWKSPRFGHFTCIHQNKLIFLQNLDFCNFSHFSDLLIWLSFLVGSMLFWFHLIVMAEFHVKYDFLVMMHHCTIATNHKIGGHLFIKKWHCFSLLLVIYLSSRGRQKSVSQMRGFNMLHVQLCRPSLFVYWSKILWEHCVD